MKLSYQLACSLFWAISSLTAQNTSILNSGDIAIIAVSAIAPKSFDCVCLVPIKAGTEVLFTDDAWIEDTKAFRGNEGTLKYTFPTDVKAGEIIHWEKDIAGFSTTGTFNFSTSGDNIICYQDTVAPQFIFATGWAKNTKGNWKFLSSASGATSTSDIPTGLSIESNTVSYLGAEASYAYLGTALCAGNKEEILVEITKASNYASRSDSALSASHLTFVIVGAPDSPAPNDKDDSTRNEPNPSPQTTPKNIGACTFTQTYGAATSLYTDQKRTDEFDFGSWHEEDTVLYMQDLSRIMLKKEFAELPTIIVNNTITTEDGSTASWYCDDEMMGISESITASKAGNYYAIAMQSKACYLQSKEIIVLVTNALENSLNENNPVLYIDFLGRRYQTPPAVPHICIYKDLSNGTDNRYKTIHIKTE